jgi:two-component system NtrC family sensor kinase
MRRGSKPSKAKVERERSEPPESRKSESSSVRDLEERLAEALKREAEAQGRLQTRNRELAEALERETATSEILRVISGSPTDVAPIFDTIAERAWRLCGATRAAVYRFDGSLVHFVAHHGYSAEALGIARALSPSPPDRSRAATRAIIDRTVVHIPDVFEDTEHRQPDLARAVGVRSLLGVPMLRNGEPLGAFFVGREHPGPFSDGQIALLQTFADQAVIAIENVRLFKELQERNHELTEALDRQTATSEVLRVISSSPTDVQPVFDAILRDAVRLCGGVYGMIWRYDGEMVDLAGLYNFPAAEVEEVRNRFPQAAGEHDIHKEVRAGHVIDIPDVQDPAHIRLRPNVPLEGWRRRGVRSIVVVPMCRETKVVGAIGVSHRDVGAFSSGRIELLQTFADQAVIAIENVRLFTELQASNRDLKTPLISKPRRAKSCVSSRAPNATCSQSSRPSCGTRSICAEPHREAHTDLMET